MVGLMKPNILFFDMETAPYLAYIWALGKQVLRHHQLHKEHCQPRIICITYCWNDNKPAKCIDWGYDEQNTKKVVQEFDEIVRQADYVIGKNNLRFDNKMLNAARLLNGLEAFPEWTRYTDDLEQQMRRYFRLPSHSLDYISDQLGLGGKIKMEMQDWIDIVEKTPNGQKSLNKMIKYGKKDVIDTRKLWYICSRHFEPKFNMGAYLDRKLACKNCGSYNVAVNKTCRVGGSVRYREYICNDCSKQRGYKVYAGRISANRKNGRLL